MSVTEPTTGTLQVRLARLFAPANVREIDEDYLATLTLSIQTRGKVVVPVEVIDSDPGVHGDAYDHVLVAGFHRVEAAKRLGHETVPAVYGDAEHEQTDRALENITRKDLNPYEEAVAVKAVLDRGFSEEGAAHLLGWDRRRVTARVKLLELPDRAQQLVGDGTIALAAVDAMRTIQQTSPALLDVAVDYIEHYADRFDADQLARQPLWVLNRALWETEADVFAAPLRDVPLHARQDLQLGEDTEALIAEATELNKKVDRRAYGPPRMRFTEAEVDRARAAGVLLEYGNEDPLVTDLALYQDLCRTAIASGLEDLKRRVAEHGQAKKAKPAADKPADPMAELDTAHRREIRALAATAHAANLDLGDSLRDGLSVVDPADLNVAKFFVYGLLGADSASIYSSDTYVSTIALRGIRLVIGDFRQDVTKTKKDGTRGALRITYGDGLNHSNQAHWLWTYLGGAKTAGELYGRALVVIAAEQYASRLVVPASQQRPPLRWGSHNDIAIKALKKLAGPHLAPTLKALEKAVAQAKREHDEARAALHAAAFARQSQHASTEVEDLGDGEDEVDGDADGIFYEDDPDLYDADSDPAEAPFADQDAAAPAPAVEVTIIAPAPATPASPTPGDAAAEVELAPPASDAAELAPLTSVAPAHNPVGTADAAAAAATSDVIDASAEIDF